MLHVRPIIRPLAGAGKTRVVAGSRRHPRGGSGYRDGSDIFGFQQLPRATGAHAVDHGATQLLELQARKEPSPTMPVAPVTMTFMRRRPPRPARPDKHAG